MKKLAKRAAGSARNGTQSIERAITLLREISTRGDLGWQLADIADRCRLGKSTTHRILTCLVRERMVRHRPSDRHYIPGPMLFELGLSVAGFGELESAARRRLLPLAQRTGGVASLFFRSGDDYVCAFRVGDTALRVFKGFQGLRRPLVTSAGGVAILLAMPASEARAIVRRNLSTLPGRGKYLADAVSSMFERSRSAGFAVNAGDILPGVNSYAWALLDTEGDPFASIMIAAEDVTLPLSQLNEIKQSLQTVAVGLQPELLGCGL